MKEKDLLGVNKEKSVIEKEQLTENSGATIKKNQWTKSELPEYVFNLFKDNPKKIEKMIGMNFWSNPNSILALCKIFKDKYKEEVFTIDVSKIDNNLWSNKKFIFKISEYLQKEELYQIFDHIDKKFWEDKLFIWLMAKSLMNWKANILEYIPKKYWGEDDFKIMMCVVFKDDYGRVLKNYIPGIEKLKISMEVIEFEEKKIQSEEQIERSNIDSLFKFKLDEENYMEEIQFIKVDDSDEEDDTDVVIDHSMVF